MKRTPIIPIKWINEQHDSDWDGVPNYRDCQLFNPHKHGIIKKFKEKEAKQKADAYEALRKHKLGIKKLPPWEVRNLKLLAGPTVHAPFVCMICKKGHSNIMRFHYSGLEYLGNQCQTTNFCSEKCFKTLNIPFKKVIVQRAKKTGGLKDAWTRYGDWMATKKGYREYAVLPNGTSVPIKDYQIDDDVHIDPHFWSSICSYIKR